MTKKKAVTEPEFDKKKEEQNFALWWTAQGTRTPKSYVALLKMKNDLRAAEDKFNELRAEYESEEKLHRTYEALLRGWLAARGIDNR